MQKPEFYRIALSDLTNEEFTEVVGRELRRRKCIGTILCCAPDEVGTVYSAAVFPDEWERMQGIPVADQLLRYAAFIHGGEEVAGRLLGEDDDRTASA